METKSPIRVAIETYVAEAESGPIPKPRLQTMLIDVAKVAIEQEFDRCIHSLVLNRPILSRYNRWRDIIGEPK